MKTWIRASFATAVVAAASLAAPVAIAGAWGDCGATRGAQGGHGGAMHEMHRMHGMKHRADPAALMKRADQRLAKLEAALALAPEQRDAWDEFSSTTRGKAAKAAEHMESMRNRERPATALERMERMEEFGKQRLESMQQMRQGVTALYARLDDGQKKTFDEQFRLVGPGFRGDGRHGLDRMERGTERGPGA